MNTATVKVVRMICIFSVQKMQIQKRHNLTKNLGKLSLCIFSLALYLAILMPAAVWARTVVDSANRVVEIPDEINRVFSAGAPASVVIYALHPQLMLGWTRALSDAEKRFVAPPYRNLPGTGRLTGRGGDANIERMLALKPDLIVDFGSVRDTYIDLANRIQEQTGIPYLLIDGKFDETANSLRLLGSVLGVPERGELLASNVENTFAELESFLSSVPLANRPRTYLARQQDGLQTGVKGSLSTEIIERAGGQNVAEVPGQYGIVQALPEQILLSNPEVIITREKLFYAQVWDDPFWAGISAVQNSRVYLSPDRPFGWIDAPPSVNRLIGLKWLAGALFPAYWQGDLRQDTRDFYQLWYHIDLTDDDLDQLLEWTKGRIY